MFEYRKAFDLNPQILLMYGSPKVGKTTALSQISQDCLIIDTECGARKVDGVITEANNLENLRQIIGVLSDNFLTKQYKYIALDTIHKIVEWCEDDVVREHNAEDPANPIKVFSDLGFGKGYAKREQKVKDIIYAFKSYCDYLILVGHRKIASQLDNGLVDPSSLDLSGKLRNTIFAMCDAAGYVHWDENQNLCISFKSDNGNVEAGSRCEHLKNKDIPLKWSNIYLPKDIKPKVNPNPTKKVKRIPNKNTQVNKKGIS